MDILFLIGRVMYGGFFLMMGLNHFMKMNDMVGYAASKGMKSAKSAIVLSGILLVFGGLGILLGAYIQYAVLALALFLIPVSFKMHDFWKQQDLNVKMVEMSQFMKNMALLGGALMLLAIPEPWVFAAF